MKFLMLIMTIFVFIASSLALTCPTNLKEIGGVCGVTRTIRGDCPDNTRYDVNKNLCVMK